MNFVIAGRDTTACLLSWTFFVLSTHPDLQAKLMEEVDKVLPNKKSPSFKAVAANSMPYLHGFIYEILRVYPPVPFDSKCAQVDDVLPDGTKVPKGATLVFLPYAMGRDPARYPDPLVVRPERWIPFVNPQPHEFPVFQAGPRICLGLEMAIFEAKVATIMLLQRFSFELVAGEKEKVTYSNTLTMSVCNSKTQDSHNVWVIPSRRT